jgi:hypothetical protein
MGTQEAKLLVSEGARINGSGLSRRCIVAVLHG